MNKASRRAGPPNRPGLGVFVRPARAPDPAPHHYDRLLDDAAGKPLRLRRVPVPSTDGGAVRATKARVFTPHAGRGHKGTPVGGRALTADPPQRLSAKGAG